MAADGGRSWWRRVGIVWGVAAGVSAIPALTQVQSVLQLPLYVPCISLPGLLVGGLVLAACRDRSDGGLKPAAISAGAAMVLFWLALFYPLLRR